MDEYFNFYTNIIDNNCKEWNIYKNDIINNIIIKSTKLPSSKFKFVYIKMIRNNIQYADALQYITISPNNYHNWYKNYVNDVSYYNIVDNKHIYNNQYQSITKNVRIVVKNRELRSYNETRIYDDYFISIGKDNKHNIDKY